LNAGFGKFFTRDKVIIFIALFVLGYALTVYSGSKNFRLDGMDEGRPDDSAPKTQPSVNDTSAQHYAPPPSGVAQQGGYSPQSVANPGDLLPKDVNGEWSSLNPAANNPNGIVMPDLLQAGYHIGLDTIGQTLRNANQQLRSDPIIPKAEVGPWNHSTIEPDLGRTPLEIGSCR